MFGHVSEDARSCEEPHRREAIRDVSGPVFGTIKEYTKSSLSALMDKVRLERLGPQAMVCNSVKSVTTSKLEYEPKELHHPRPKEAIGTPLTLVHLNKNDLIMDEAY
ncbi:hypothetical protein NDU88_002520 [Pleurodeles waltl]|uniref:Uncharacterized protein n=1 Tax=Pleurodeles waltl TaxID=8319 RepID=A0AAV7P6Y7_PLEWA|nr:hypothetical protein NDU88_002520 [Pleurodeles waltl]